MSRSYRRPWVRDGFNSKKHTKQIFNRRYRRVCKTILNSYFDQPYDSNLDFAVTEEEQWDIDWEVREMPEPDFPHPKTFSDSYDICDRRFYAPNWDRAHRK